MYRLALLVGIAVAAHGQKAPTKDDLILGKLDQILKILNEADQPPQPTRAKVAITDDPTLGTNLAPVTIVEFTDYQCPYCAKWHTENFAKLLNEYISTDKVRFVSRDLPLSIHPNAEQAAEAGRCAREQGQFWEMRSWMQANPTQLDLEHLKEQAIEMRMDIERFRHCLATARYKKTIKLAVEDAHSLHITGTPTFVIGKTAAIVDGEVVIGAVPYQTFEDKLNALLK